MRVYVSSTSDDLERHRQAALEVAREIGVEPIVRDPAARRGLSRVEACGRQVADADLLLAIVGWRTGEVPGPELGGDGNRSWTEWEVKSAFDRGLPVAVMMAGDSWPLRETDAVGSSMVRDFRGELDRLAVRFAGKPENGLGDFRELLRRRLLDAARGERQASDAGASIEGLRLRRWPAPELPARPFPLLLPYTHPDLMAGRERELAELRRLLTLPVPILGLYAASGTGKSSLLSAGLVPGLRAEGRPVAFDRHPCEAGLTGRLVRDLLEATDEEALEIAGDDVAGRGPEAFVELMLATRRLAVEPPVLILDQFEDLLRRSGERRARALVGTLLAASVQRQPGLDGPPCRWLLAYRQEFHGEVFQWLADVLRDARAEGFAAISTQPHDLSGPERFNGWPLAPLGTPEPGSSDRVADAARVFQAAIEKPLELPRSGSGGGPTQRSPGGGPTQRSSGGGPTRHYPWRFADGSAARLARAFGEARVAQPRAPLAPELQVVLAHLLELAGEPYSGEPTVVTVPEEPAELIDQALQQHLRRAIDAAFPTGGPSLRQARGARRPGDARIGAASGDAKIARTRALLALRELADVQGRRDQGLPVESLARAIGPRGGPAEGRRVLERLATPEARLVVLEKQAGVWCYVLSHDRMAELLVRLVDGEGAYAGFGIDAELLALRRFVKLKSELFAAGEVKQATEVPAGHFDGIERHAAALLWGEQSERWWRACQARAEARARRTGRVRAVAVLVVSALVAGVWWWTDRRARRTALFEEAAGGEPEAAFAAAERLLVEWRAEPEALRAALRQREQPLDLLDRGVGGVTDGRSEAVLRLAELALPLITDDAPEDPVRIASLVWALDFFAPHDERTRRLRQAALEPLRSVRSPPAPDDVDRVRIPTGTFQMGSAPGEGRDDEDKLDERPRHRVTLSAFSMATHEVTNREFRRLYPGHAEGQNDRLPAVGLTWYQAYTYAAWLGGRLPTEAEAEYARRGGCDFAYCRHDGSEASLDEVAWWVGNSTDPETGDQAPKPVGRLEPNPWGLYDLYGNVWELGADWYGGYAAQDQADPPGPTRSTIDCRTARGGSFSYSAEWVVASGRGALTSDDRAPDHGLRVVWPIAE